MAIYGDDKSIAKTNNSEKLSPINILSVDFDWIMEPSIEIYNPIVSEEVYPWPAIQKRCPGVKFECDLNKYAELCLYLGNIIAKLPSYRNFVYDISHKGIIQCMNNWNIGNQPYNIVNIDHHHDCGYSKDPNPTYEMLLDELNSANWVLHMMEQHPNCKKYTWICNSNSICDIYDECLPKLPTIYQSIDLAPIEYMKFDYVFLCKSEAWIPPEYQPLYAGLSHLLEQIAIK